MRRLRFFILPVVVAMACLAGCAPHARSALRRSDERVYEITVGVAEAPPGEVRGRLTVWVRRPGEMVRPLRVESLDRIARAGTPAELRFAFSAPANPERFDLSLEVGVGDGRLVARPLDAGDLFALAPRAQAWVRFDPSV